MLPTTLTSLLILVAVLLPGAAYVVSRDKYRPQAKPSRFREITEVVGFSVVALIGVLCLFAVLRIRLPGHTPDIGRLVADPGAYATAHYRELAAWAVALLAAATLATGFTPYLTRKGEPHPSNASGWWNALDSWRPGGATVQVGCWLEDGSWVRGSLVSFSVGLDETADRDIVVGEPLYYAPPGGDEQPFPGSVYIVSARRIMWISVTYVDPSAAQQSGASERPAPSAETPASSEGWTDADRPAFHERPDDQPPPSS